MKINVIQIVETFNEAINTGNIHLLSSLMTEDHTFIDSGGTVTTGKERMTQGWQEFFKMFPEYKNNFEIILQENDVVAAFGTVTMIYNGKRGLVPENRIKMPAAWKAVVENDKIKQWQVYADWTEGSKIIEEDNKFS